MILCEFITAFALIINCNSMYITLSPHGDLVKRLSTWLVLAGLLGIILFSGTFLNSCRLSICLIYVLIFGVFLTGYILATDFYNFTAFFRFAAVFFMLIIYYFLVHAGGEIPGVLVRYRQIMTVLAAFSILCWLVFSLFKLIPANSLAYTWWNGTDGFTRVKSYYGIYFSPQTIGLFGTRINRNCAVFVEAPIASLHFSFALLAECFLKKKSSVPVMAILIAAIITTFSAAGCIIAAAAMVVKLILYILGSEKYRALSGSKKTAIRIIIAALIILAVAAAALIIYGRIGDKSWRIRVQDMRATILAWLDKPIYGNGVNNFDAVKMHFGGTRVNNPGYSCTTSLGTILAEGGLMFGVLYIGAVVMAVIRAVRNKEYGNIFFSIFILIIFTVTIVNYDYIVLLMFVFMGAYKCRGARYIAGCENK